MAKTKKLGRRQIQQSISHYKETQQLQFTIDGEEYTVTVHPFLSPKDITKVITEFQQDLLGYKKYKIEVKDEDIFNLLSYCLVLNASDLYKPTKEKFKKEESYYKQKIQYFGELVNSFVFKEIGENISEETKNALIEKLIEIKQEDDKIQRQITKLQSDIAHLNLENKEVADKFQNFKPKQIPEV